MELFMTIAGGTLLQEFEDKSGFGPFLLCGPSNMSTVCNKILTKTNL
jgi:hypothetical protein